MLPCVDDDSEKLVLIIASVLVFFMVLARLYMYSRSAKLLKSYISILGPKQESSSTNLIRVDVNSATDLLAMLYLSLSIVWWNNRKIFAFCTIFVVVRSLFTAH